MPPHLHIGLSSHGFGHAAQTAPIVAALRAAVPGLRISVATQMPAGPLEGFLGPVERIGLQVDVALLMDGPMDVRPDATAEAYASFHADWDGRVTCYAALLGELRPDVVLANVPALPLAAAAHAGIPACGLSSLNWAGMYRHYCAGFPDAALIHGQLLDAYRSAPFLLLTPGVPMPDLPRLQRIGPVARLGRDRRDEIARRIGLRAGERLALISTGGLPASICYDGWEPIPGWHLLVQGDVGGRADMTAMAALDMPTVDLIRSVDVVVTKTGYGFFVEAACNGKPTLFMRRVNWPEEPHVSDWLLANAAAIPVDRGELEAGRVGAGLDAVMHLPKPAIPQPNGIDDALRFLEPFFSPR